MRWDVRRWRAVLGLALLTGATALASTAAGAAPSSRPAATEATGTHPCGTVHVNTILEKMEFARQVLREATRLMRELGITHYDHHSQAAGEFPLDAYLMLHEIVTGQPRPTSFAGELVLINDILKGTDSYIGPVPGTPESPTGYFENNRFATE